MLKVTDLKVKYGMIEAIKGISFEVRDGEIVTMIGANGAGKTTTMHAISGLVKAAEGSIMLDRADKDPRQQDRRTRPCAGSGRQKSLCRADCRGESDPRRLSAKG